MTAGMMQVGATLVERRVMGAVQELRLQQPQLAARLTAGQPVLVRTGWGMVPYLRRALYPIAITADSWVVRLPADGDPGHAWLRTVPEGTELDCLGPIGLGFHLPDDTRRVLCLGEGEAAWCLLPLVVTADTLAMAVALAVEVLTEREAIPAPRLPPAVEYRLLLRGGRHGPERLEDAWGDLLPWADVVMAAGSVPFYRRLVEAIRTHRLMVRPGLAQVLYPATLLCGTGACLACVADVAGGRRRVCRRGPVFDLTAVVEPG
jgi:NAD(P)H-flavin reductase